MVRQERERRFISEYVLQTFPPGQWVLNVPIGPVPQELVQIHGVNRAAAIFRPSRRRIDAVAWTKDTYWIIEAKIRDPFEGIGRLIVYKEDAAESPDLPGFAGQVIVPRLVVPYVIERDQVAARKHDIEMIQFAPLWIADYVKERQLYHTAEYRARRDEKQRTRELLGVE